MRKWIGGFLILLFLISLIIWGLNDYAIPFLPSKFNDRLIEIGVVILGVITTVANFPAFLEFLRNPFGRLQKEKAEADLNVSEQKNYRRRMLEKVEKRVKEELETTIYGAVQIDLGKEYFPANAGSYPWRMTFRAQRQPDRLIPPGKSIVEIFAEAEGKLLIMGDPGAGKTTTLLSLANGLLEQARLDADAPIPVIFNLSGWGRATLPIEEWLVKELTRSYTIPEKVAKFWLVHNSIIPLLDGLDEVDVRSRNTCVRAINAYHQENSFIQIAVCSRLDEYMQLRNRLGVGNSIVLLPLSDEQIQAYLDGVGPELMAVKDIISEDPDFKELARSPLWLSIMTIAYRGKSFDAVRSLQMTENRRKHVIKHYVDRVLESKRANPIFSKEQVVYGMSWLANQLKQRGLVALQVESIRPSWLETPPSSEMYWFKYFDEVFPITRLDLFKVMYTLLMIVLWGGLGLLFFAPIGWMIFGLLLGMLLGLGFSMGIFDNEEFFVETSEVKKFSFPSFRSFFGSIIFYLIAAGGVIGLIAGFIQYGVVPGIVGGMLGGVFIAFMSSIFLCQVYDENNSNQAPNQVTWLALKNSLVSMLILSIFIGAPVGLIAGPVAGLGAAIFSSLFVGFFTGLHVFTSHFLTRFYFYIENVIPWNLVKFLDYAVDRLILQKTGGGYKFIHGLVMEYFADLYVLPVNAEMTTR